MIGRVGLFATCALLIGLISVDARAQNPINFADAVAQCRAEGAGPWAFGDDLSNAAIKSTSRFGPFGKALARTTIWSERVARIELTAEGIGEKVGLENERDLVAAFEAAGWKRVKMAANLDIGLVLIESNYIMTPPGFEDAAQSPFFAGISWFPEALRLTCTNAELTRLDRAEMDGELQTGSAHPGALPAITATRPTVKDCADNSFTDNLELIFGESSRDTWADQSAMRAGHVRRIETWVRWKLQTSGKVTEEQLWAIEDRLAETSSDEQSPEAAMAEGMEIFTLMPEIDRARAKGDTAALCPLYIRIVDTMAKGDERLLSRWARAEPLYNAIADAAGVDLRD